MSHNTYVHLDWSWLNRQWKIVLENIWFSKENSGTFQPQPLFLFFFLACKLSQNTPIFKIWSIGSISLARLYSATTRGKSKCWNCFFATNYNQNVVASVRNNILNIKGPIKTSILDTKWLKNGFFPAATAGKDYGYCSVDILQTDW